MKSKLTITVDSDLIPAAKLYARSRGVSLSSVIEQALREATGETEPSFMEYWRERFAETRKTPPEPGTDPRYDALVRKHLYL